MGFKEKNRNVGFKLNERIIQAFFNRVETIFNTDEVDEEKIIKNLSKEKIERKYIKCATASRLAEEVFAQNLEVNGIRTWYICAKECHKLLSIYMETEGLNKHEAKEFHEYLYERFKVAIIDYTASKTKNASYFI